jgi:hypothetical protein
MAHRVLFRRGDDRLASGADKKCRRRSWRRAAEYAPALEANSDLSRTFGTTRLKTCCFANAGQLRVTSGSLAKHFFCQNSRLLSPRLSGGLGVGSSNLPAPTNEINSLSTIDHQFDCKTSFKLQNNFVGDQLAKVDPPVSSRLAARRQPFRRTSARGWGGEWKAVDPLPASGRNRATADQISEIAAVTPAPCNSFGCSLILGRRSRGIAYGDAHDDPDHH